MTTFTSWNTELYHFGIKGQKWGRRRWQNEDGSLTEAGRRRYGTIENYNRIHNRKKLSDMTDDEIRSAIARKNLEYEYRMAGGGGKIIKAIKSINDAYDKKKQQKIDLANAKTEMEKAKSESIKAIEATKKAGKEVKKAKQEAKREKNKHTTWQDRRIIAKQLRKTDTTAEIEEAKAHRMSMQATLKEVEGRASTVEKMLKRNTLWDYIKGTAVRNVKGVYGIDRVQAVQDYLQQPVASKSNKQKDKDGKN